MANVKDPRLCAWLAWYFKRTSGRTRVFPGSRTQLVDTMRGSLCLLKIAPGTFSLGSFRVGGATEHCITEKNIGLLQFQGRWRNTQTLYHYIQVWMSQLGNARLSTDASLSVDEAATFFDDLGGPPEHLKN